MDMRTAAAVRRAAVRVFMRVESEAEGDEPALLGLDELGGLDLARAVAEGHLDAGAALAGLNSFLGDGFHDGDVAKTALLRGGVLGLGGAFADLASAIFTSASLASAGTWKNFVASAASPR